MTHSQPAGYLALPSEMQGPPILVLHAWWGLNNDIRSICDRLAEEGFPAFALDLYHGQVAETAAQAEALGGSLDARYEQALGEVAQATAWLSERYAHGKQGLAIIALSLGVWYALEQSNADPEHLRKVVVFYGTRAGDYSNSQSAYLGHFAENDPYEPQENISAMVQDMAQAGQPVRTYTYPGTRHWFFEPGRPEAYDKEASQLAWARTLAFLQT